MEERFFLLSSKMMRIGRLRRQIVDNSVEELGLMPSQHYVLMQLSREGSVPSQVEIARMRHVSPASVARTVKNLDAQGYIRRHSGGADGRMNAISITEKGERLVRRGHAFFQRMEAASFAGFSDAELAQFSALLDRVLENLTHIEEATKGS